MLNNLRNKFDPMLEKVGAGFAKLGFGPGFWTWVGLILSIISAIMFSLHSPAIGIPWYTATLLGGIFLIIAGFFDAVDGAVARATKKTSALGGFLDSVIDKISEIIVFVGILIGSYTNPVLVLVAMSLSLLVSYTRAKGESMGVDLKGKGIAERAERILIISILAFIPFRDNISVALWIVSILAIITVLQRLNVVSSIFGVSIFSIQALKGIFKREGSSDSSSTIFKREGSSDSSSTMDKVKEKTKGAKDAVVGKTKDVAEKTKDTVLPSETERGARSEEGKDSQQPRKAIFIDNGSDPNETGRNTDQIISELEEEDRKIAKSVPPAPSPPPPPNLKKDNKKPSTTTSSTTTTSPSEASPSEASPSEASPSEASPSEIKVKKEDSEKANELQ